MRFRNRRDAGRQLAELLTGRSSSAPLLDPLVLGLPRGGVPVAYEVAALLAAPLDVLVARKVGAPGHEEYGIGAIAEGVANAVMTDRAARVGVGPVQFEELARREHVEVARQVALYRRDRPMPSVAARDVILVDDGLATGVTAEAAILAVRAQHPARVLLAVPVGAPDTAARLGSVADEVVAVLTPEGFIAVGTWYDDFGPTPDREVLELLADARARWDAPG
jgi:predicted phosphoribosyltransferase